MFQIPAKLILSGEHSVVYGHPALAMPLFDLTTESTICESVSDGILFKFPILNYQKHFSAKELLNLKKQIDLNYAEFLYGNLPIEAVLDSNAELLIYAFVHFCEKFNCFESEHLEIYLDSNIPIGCGMGSSAALIICLLRSLADFFSLDLLLEDFWKTGCEIEKLQHGRTSGLDLNVVLHQKCILFEKGKFETRSLPTVSISTINTGKPECSTGACVMQVRKYFQSSSLGNDFSNVTRTLDDALWRNDLGLAREAIRENQRLLEYIGVVPEKVKVMIQKLNAEGKAAKVCGAGAICGDRAGVVLIV